jgi:OmpA-OmpF porin, OOP family
MFRIVFASLVFIIPNCALAQEAYVRGSIGPNFSGSPEAAGDITQVHTATGIVGTAAVGVFLNRAFRVEIEGDIRSDAVNSIDTLRKDGSMEPLGNPGGSLKQYSVMANAIYQIPVGTSPFAIQPYLGAGIGYTRLDLSNVYGAGETIFSLPQNNTYTGPSNVQFGSAGALSYQGIVGVAVPVKAVRHLSVTLEYRYFGVGRAGVPVNRTATGGNTVNGVVPSATATDRFDGGNNSVLVGLSYRFGH